MGYGTATMMAAELLLHAGLVTQRRHPLSEQGTVSHEGQHQHMHT